MDWKQAIERQRAALAGIVAALFEMAGMAGGGGVSRLPFPVYRAILRILYPAESAVRRLIAVVARGLPGQLPAKRPVPPVLKILSRKQARRMAFQLCDARRNFNAGLRRPGSKFEPRIHAFRDGQLVTIVGRSPLAPAPQRAETVDASRLCRRLGAIKWALENLPREARRLARWRARQAALPPEKFRKSLRPGPPPGHRKIALKDVDEVLKDCHWLAWESARADTS